MASHPRDSSTSHGAIRVRVELSQQRTIVIDVTEETSILAFKEQISSATKIPVIAQNLFFRGEILKDSFKVSDYKISQDPVITLKDDGQLSYVIHVSTPLGTPIPLDVKAWHTVSDIKEIFHQKTGVDISSHRLFWGRSALTNPKMSLLDLQIPNNSKLALLFNPSDPCTRIEIKSHFVTPFYLNVKPSHTIKQIKEMIHQNTGRTPRNQILLYLEKRLNDSQSLKDCMIQHDSLIHLSSLPSIQISAKSMTGELIPVDVFLDDTIKLVKRQIEFKKNIPVFRQKLLFAGKELDDLGKLKDYGVKRQSVLDLHLNVSGSTVHLFVKTPMGTRMSWKLDTYCTVMEIKGLIREKEGIPIENQSLFYEKELDDRESLDDCGIPNKGVITLSLKGLETCTQIFIKRQDNEPIRLSVDQYQMLRTVKAMIQDKTGMEPAKQILKYFGMNLVDDKKTLHELEIHHGAMIHLVERGKKRKSLYVHKSEKNRIFVNTPSGIKETVHVEWSTTTVLDVKRVLKERQEIPLDKQILAFQIQTLEDSKRLLDYSVKDNDTLTLTRAIDPVIAQKIEEEVARVFDEKESEEPIEDIASFLANTRTEENTLEIFEEEPDEEDEKIDPVEQKKAVFVSAEKVSHVISRDESLMEKALVDEETGISVIPVTSEPVLKIKLDTSYDEWTQHKEDSFKNDLASQLGVNPGDVQIIFKKRGSVQLQIILNNLEQQFKGDVNLGVLESTVKGKLSDDFQKKYVVIKDDTELKKFFNLKPPPKSSGVPPMLGASLSKAQLWLVKKAQTIKKDLEKSLQKTPYEFKVRTVCILNSGQSKCMERFLKHGTMEQARVLFHGTALTNIKSIADNGFNLAKLGANTGNTGWYGRGLYFTAYPQYAMRYARQGTVRKGNKFTLVVSYVLTGKTQELTERPKKPNGSWHDGIPIPPQYHSNHIWVENCWPVKKDKKGALVYDEWVIGDGSRILPAYAVTVECVSERCVMWRDPKIGNSHNSGILKMILKQVPAYGVRTSKAGWDLIRYKQKGKGFVIMTNGADDGEGFIRYIRNTIGCQVPILVYCTAVSWHKKWAKKYPKVHVTTNSVMVRNWTGQKVNLNDGNLWK